MESIHFLSILLSDVDPKINFVPPVKINATISKEILKWILERLPWSLKYLTEALFTTAYIYS